MSWLEDKQKITEAYFTAINKNNLELYRVVSLHLQEVQPIFPLLQFILSRIETVTVLTTSDKLWDAEIILRSALETFVKFTFITSADKIEREKRLDEYWNLLAEVNAIKHSEQAKLNLKFLGHLETHNIAFTPILLPKKDENTLRSKWSKSARQKLEQKWSFTEMVASISKNYRGKPLELFTTLTHGYRMSSHVTHGDETGILIIVERNERTQEEQNVANFAHYLRLLSDSNVYCAFVAVETMNYLNLDNNFFFKNQEILKEIDSLTEKYHNNLFEDPLYTKFRTQKKDPTSQNSE